MKKQTSSFEYKKTVPSSLESKLDKVRSENAQLKRDLLEATEKQHQEMSRAIGLKEKNRRLHSQIATAKIEVSRLRDLNHRLKGLKF